MNNVLADEEASFVIDFKDEGQLVVPDSGSVNWLLRSNDGTKTVTETSLSTDDTTTQVTITVPASEHSKTGDTEKRTLVVNYKVNSHPKQIICHYRVVNWLNIALTVDMIRDWMGLNRAELPDEDFDLVDAYFEVKNDLGDNPSMLDDALIDTTSRRYDANMAILYRSVLMIAPSVQYRATFSESDEQLSWTRQNQTNVDRLVEQAKAEYTRVLKSIQNISDTVGPTLFTLSNPGDPVVGNAS